MPAAQDLYVPLAILAGILFAILGVSYRLGQTRGVTAMHIIVIDAVAGCLYFGVQAAGAQWSHVPPVVMLAGAAVGFSQYLCLLTVRPALRLGPLSAMMCVCSMAFVPVAVYAYFVHGEKISPWQYASLPVAVACIVAASLSPGGTDQSLRQRGFRWDRTLLYGLILLLQFALNAIPWTAIKDLGTRPAEAGKSYMDLYGSVYFVCFFAAMGICCLAHMVIFRSYPRRWRTMLWVGLLGSAGSVLGIAATAAAAAGPAATVITLNNVTTVVVTAVIAAIFFREGRTVWWYVTVVCGILAVVLGKLG